MRYWNCVIFREDKWVIVLYIRRYGSDESDFDYLIRIIIWKCKWWNDCFKRE